MSKCSYIDECGSPCDCNKENPDCRIREKLEQIKKENEHLKNKLDALLSIGYNKWMYYIANGINNAGDITIQYLLEDLGKVVNLLARVCEIKNNTLSYYTNADKEWSQVLQIVEQAKETEHEKN